MRLENLKPLLFQMELKSNFYIQNHNGISLEADGVTHYTQIHTYPLLNKEYCYQKVLKNFYKRSLRIESNYHQIIFDLAY